MSDWEKAGTSAKTAATWVRKAMWQLKHVVDTNPSTRWIVGYNAESLLNSILDSAESLVPLLNANGEDADADLEMLERDAQRVVKALRARRLSLKLKNTAGRTPEEAAMFLAKSEGTRLTLSPLVEPGIRGMPGDLYKVSPICCVPKCRKRSNHAHHLWPRSALKKDYEWVRLPSGQVIGNRAGICLEHHTFVTGGVGGHAAWITCEDDVLYWNVRGDSDGHWERVGLLVPQPPRAGERLAEAIEGAYVCPTCGHVHKPPSLKEPLPPRKSTRWTVTVPADAEVGGEVLDVLVDELALVIGAEDWTSRFKRYHVLTRALYWAVQNRTELLRDIEESESS